jgi:hypothetical protein
MGRNGSLLPAPPQVGAHQDHASARGVVDQNKEPELTDRAPQQVDRVVTQRDMAFTVDRAKSGLEPLAVAAA